MFKRHFTLAATLLGAGLLAACPGSAEHASKAYAGSGPESRPASRPAQNGTSLAPPPPRGLEVATFAGGCFWCMEPPFEKLPGVKSVISGYTGGTKSRPTYREIGMGRTGHAEAVQVLFDPDYVTYEELLDTFWMNIDPTDRGGQFADRGNQYRTGIFVHSEAQRRAAEASKKRLAESKRFKGRIVTPIEDAKPFWVAEEYHQDFYKKKPEHYARYRKGSGREAFIEKHWGAKAAER